MGRGGPGRLRGYGDLGLRARAEGRGLRVRSMAATDEALGFGALALNAACSLAPTRRLLAVRDKGNPHRLLALNNR